MRLRHRLSAVYTGLPVADFVTPVPVTHYMVCMIGSGIAAHGTNAVFVIRVSLRLRHRLVTVLANAPMTIGIRIVPIRHFVGMTHFGMAAYGANTVLIKYMLLGLRHRLFAVYTYLPVADFVTPVPTTHYMVCMIGSGISAYRTYAVFVIRVPLRLRHRLVAVLATMPVAVDIRTVPIRHLVSMARFGIAAHGTNAVFVIGMICGVKMDLFIFQRLVAGADSHRIPLFLASGEEKRRIPCATERIVADGIQCVGKADLLKIKATQKSRLSDFCQRSRQSRRSQLIASGKRRSSNRRHAFLNDKALNTVPIAHPGCLVAHSPRTVNGQCSITAETPGQIVPVLAKCSGVHDRIRQARRGIPCPLPCKHCAGDQAENHCQCQKDTCNFPFHKRYPSSSTFLY